ncbi:MAG: hypothetical protein WD027_01295 [Gaiellales bacterium]
MDEARRVIERLERIEELRRAEAPPPVLLAEVRGLLAEGERWLAVEHAGGRAHEALDRCRARIEEAPRH